MHKRSLSFGILLLCLASLSVYAGGRKDNESHDVADPAGFAESINIESKSPGKWNFYLEAQDRGGNTAIAGPHNMYIDPESDLPIARIINPQSNMHVQGNLNIVGTAIDDDGVASVDIIVTRGADGRGEVMLQTRAEGSEFWSYFLDTTDTERWRDGVYTITAWATDINGLSGISDRFPAKSHKRHQVIWNLDRKKPDIQVTSHALGDLVNGRVNIKGTIWDGNGIDNFGYSLNNGLRYTPASIKYDNRADIYSFDVSIDTRTFEDGPAVVMFRAKDKMKTEGFLSFLIFANNTGPDVQILYPEPEEAVNGIFTVAGYAMHQVGLSSLSWRLGKDSGEIPLIIGNPWWVQEFDIRGQNVKTLDLEIIAKDYSGNTTTARRRLIVDQDADLPKITLNAPEAGTVIPVDGLSLIGTAIDNDGVESILYSIDGAPAVEIPGSEFFQFKVKDIPDGIHNLDVWARDITGVAGPKVSVKGIIAPGMLPEPRIVRVSSGAARAAIQSDFYSGIDVNNQLGASFDLLVSSGSALQSISYQLGSADPVLLAVRGARPGDYMQNIPIPREAEPGQMKIEIRAKDMYDRETVMEDYIHITGPEGRQSIGAESFTWVNPDTSIGGGQMLLASRTPITGIYNRNLLRSVEVSGEDASSFRATLDENGLVNLTALADGHYSIQLNLTDTNGRRFTTPEFRFLVDSAAPELELVENQDGKWLRNELSIKLRAADTNQIRSMDYSFDMGSNWRSLVQPGELAELSYNDVIENTLNISSLADGVVAVFIRAIDEANRETVKSFQIHKDTKAPESRLIVPISGAKVNGTIRLGIELKEAGKFASITYERPEKYDEETEITTPAISRQIYPGSRVVSTAEAGSLTFLDLVLDANEIPLSQDMSFTFTDMAGNTSTLSRWPFIIDQEMDLPVLQISLPIEDEVISSDFIVSGVCFDDDQVKQIYWSMDDGYERILEATHGYSFIIPLSSMTDNEHSITIYAEDLYGVKGRPVTRNFKISLEEPKAAIAIPTAGEIVGGTVVIAGVALDENGIRGVQVSVDNGNSFNDAEGTTRWMYTFNSRILPDGSHPVFVRAWDNYEITATYAFLVNIDNTAPELTVDTPKDGAETTGPIYITGQVMDNIMLDSVSIVLNSLEGVEIPEYLAQREAKLDSLLLEELDLSSLPDGTYNLEVWATDKAENVSRISRNITLAKGSERNFVDNLYPLNGEHLQGNFNLYGYVGGIDKATDVTLLINGIAVRSEPVSDAGYYCFGVTPEDLFQGINRLVVRSDAYGRILAESAGRDIVYRSSGPWVTVDTLNMGDFAYDRPWLMGRAGYVLTDEDQAILADRRAEREDRIDVDEKKIALIELSFNNGSTFFKAGKGRQKGFDWSYRLETGDMKEGLHYLIVRATMINGEVAVTRLLIQVDKTPPVIRLISPDSGGRYNNSIEYAALASDDVELKSMTYHLRKGDKAFYGIPGFIKGLYLEGTIPPLVKVAANNAPALFAGGATFFDVNMGLSFFDDNVKIQAGYGQMTQNQYESLGGEGLVRYGGHVLGIKLLANIYTLPFVTFMGPDWDWLSASVSLGANFSLFDLATQGYTQSGNSTWMTALLAQLEFPKVTIPRRTNLRTFSLFTEGQLWFVPTDVDAKAYNLNTVIPHVILGLRLYIF